MEAGDEAVHSVNKDQRSRKDPLKPPTDHHSRPQSLRSFWPAVGIESTGSNHFEITKEITDLCPSGLT